MVISKIAGIIDLIIVFFIYKRIMVIKRNLEDEERE